jgi:ribonuclease P protein subunit RPR2
MSRYRKKLVNLAKSVASERMFVLFELGIESVKNGDYELARRYGELIYRIAMKVRVKIPRNIKRWICKNCYVVMVPGINARIRIRRDGKTLRVITRCLTCGWIHRYEFKRCRGYGETQRVSGKAEERKGQGSQN